MGTNKKTVSDNVDGFFNHWNLKKIKLGSSLVHFQKNAFWSHSKKMPKKLKTTKGF